MNTHVCSSCGVEKPHTTQYFCMKKGKPRTICKVCQYKYSNNYYHSTLKHHATTVEYDEKWIKEQRKTKGLLQREVADATGINYCTYCSIERGQPKKITKNNLEKIRKFFEGV